MDKGRKLRRYNRKDYTQLVEFPVEIVGRDGAVRHYSFQEAVRLYQRRVASAPQRYEDADIVQAEMRHCQRRIDQLRRSYFARHGWEGLNTTGDRALSTAHAAEVAAFLRSCLGGGVLDLSSLHLSFLDETESCTTYFVREQRGLLGTGSSLLYVYTFESDDGGSSPGRAQFFSYLKLLKSVRAAEGAESLAAFHHTADCGFILTTEDPNPPLGRLPGGDEPVLPGDAQATPNPLRDALQLLRAGRETEALVQMESAYADNPYLRHAYLGAAVISDLLGEHRRAETAALMGSRYFPEDGLMAYHLAVAHIRLGQAKRATPLLAVVAPQPGGRVAVSLLRALMALDAGALSQARRHLGTVVRVAGRAEADRHSDLLHAARVLQLHLALRTLGVLLALMALTAGAGLWASTSGSESVGMVLLVLGVGSLPVGRWWSNRRLTRLVRGPGRGQLRLASLGILQGPDPS